VLSALAARAPFTECHSVYGASASETAMNLEATRHDDARTPVAAGTNHPTRPPARSAAGAVLGFDIGPNPRARNTVHIEQ
jgi:hypothetical protein